ncbi:hypothetical protein M885DRAFT_512275 [Pelagophyceae sp. CCMP2097]|nr:hypothetical protein M885DRAFT_512275 [Pelagophyceae sp. CCMP2097]
MAEAAEDAAEVAAEVKRRLTAIAKRRDELALPTVAYIQANPELDLLINGLVTAVMQARPDNVCGFAAKHFTGVRMASQPRLKRPLRVMLIGVHDRRDDWAAATAVVERVLKTEPRLQLVSSETPLWVKLLVKTPPTAAVAAADDASKQADALSAASPAKSATSASAKSPAKSPTKSTKDSPTKKKDPSSTKKNDKKGKKKSVEPEPVPVGPPPFVIPESDFPSQSIVIGADTGRWFEYGDGRATSVEAVATAAARVSGGVAIVVVAGHARAATARRLAHRDGRVQPHVLLLQSSELTHNHDRAFVDCEVNGRVMPVYDDVVTFDSVEGAERQVLDALRRRENLEDVSDVRPSN